MNACGRTVTCGAGFAQECDKPAGHAGAHESHRVDRDGRRRVGVTWTHEDVTHRHPVWPNARGAVKVTR